MDMYAYMAQLSNEHYFAYHLERFVWGKFDRHIVDEECTVAPIDWTKLHTDQIRPRDVIEEAESRSQYIWHALYPQIDLWVLFKIMQLGVFW